MDSLSSDELRLLEYILLRVSSGENIINLNDEAMESIKLIKDKVRGEHG